MQNVTVLEYRGSRKMGCTFLSRRKTAVSPLFRGALRLRARCLEQAQRRGRTRRASGLRLPLRAGRHRHGHTRWCTSLSSAPAHTASSTERPVLLRSPGHCRPRCVKLSGLQAGVAPRREKAPSTFKPTLRKSLPHLPRTVRHHHGRHPWKISPWKELQRTERDWRGEVGTPASSSWGGLGNAAGKEGKG